MSGKQNLNYAGTVDTGGGHLLLDPFSYIIDAAQALHIVNALTGNDVTIQTSADDPDQGSSGNNTDPGDIAVNAAILYDSTHDLTFLAHRHINFNASVQNGHATGGDVNVVAGWDGVTTDPAAFAAADVTTTTLFGNNSGSVFIGSDSAISVVAVEAVQGTTNVLAHDLVLRSSDSNKAYAQLGFHHVSGGTAGSTITSGNINVLATGSVSAVAGSQGAFHDVSSYVQIGHGGNRDESQIYTPWNYTGDVVLATNEDILIQGGRGYSTYAQLGNGGFSADGSHTITMANDVTIQAGSSDYSYRTLRLCSTETPGLPSRALSSPGHPSCCYGRGPNCQTTPRCSRSFAWPGTLSKP
ncbi:MAG: hypothetical protein P8J37_19280 [Fuerstiella sp.]|nr:hypothetical protein [Fuerstiella sp.]